MRLYERLDAIGLRVFLDQQELIQGDERAGKLDEAMERSHCCIVLVSEEWSDSPGCLEEADRMLARATSERGAFRVIPLLLDGSIMPGLFAERLWIDFSGDAAPTGRKLEQVMYAVLGGRSRAKGALKPRL